MPAPLGQARGLAQHIALSVTAAHERNHAEGADRGQAVTHRVEQHMARAALLESEDAQRMKPACAIEE